MINTKRNLNKQTSNLIKAAGMLGTPGRETLEHNSPVILGAFVGGVDNKTIAADLADLANELKALTANADWLNFEEQANCLALLKAFRI